MDNTVGVKQLHTDLNRIAKRVQRGEHVLVMKHAKPLFVLTPFEKHAKSTGRKKYHLNDLRKLQKMGGDKNISRDIDRIVYGV